MYSLITGFLLIYFPFGNGSFHAIITSLVVFVLMKMSPKYCGSLTWGFAFPYLIVNHVYQASGMAWKEGQLDFTGAQMMLTLKLISVAICYQDGRRHNSKSLHPYGASKRLETCPSLLEYMSYLFAFGTLLSGPFFEMKDYLDYVNRQGEWDCTRDECKIPNPLLPGLYRFGKAFLCAAIWIYFTKNGFNVEKIESSYWREDLNFVVRCLTLWITIVVYRFKYYAVWCVSESGMIFSGLGYNTRDEKVSALMRQLYGAKKIRDCFYCDLLNLTTWCFETFLSQGQPKWDRYINSHIRQVELNPSLADTPKHWNRCTGMWLRRCTCVIIVLMGYYGRLMCVCVVYRCV